jgi:hypothetical protein
VYKQRLYDVFVRFGGFETVLPTSVTLLKTLVSFFPMRCEGTFVLANVRITAPGGFKWIVDQFEGQVTGSTCGDLSCNIYSVPEVSGLYPNELVLPGVVLRPGVEYGFQTYMHIPDRPPIQSSNAFFFEIGFDNSSIAGRFQAGILNPPILRIVSAVSVFSLCNRAAFRENILEFHLTTITMLGMNEGFVFRGDQNTLSSYIKCFPRAAAESLPLPTDMQCSSFADVDTGLPVIILSATTSRRLDAHSDVANEVSSFPPGRYGFQFVDVENPLNPTGVNPTWHIGTYADVHRYPALKVIDRFTTVEAPEVLRWMPTGGILEMPEWLGSLMGKDTRPEYYNKLIFYFKVRKKHYFPPDTPYMAIRAPYGYSFAENCSLQFKPVGEQMNDTWYQAARQAPDAYNSSQKRWPCEKHPLEWWCPGIIEEIPKYMQPKECLGLGNTARIVIPPGEFMDDKFYAFEIGFTNPLSGTTKDRWAFDVGEEASEPLDSFAITSFIPAGTSVQASSKNIQKKNAQKEMSPVSILFTPYTTVPARLSESNYGLVQGSFTLKLPTGFKLTLLTDPQDFPAACLGTTVLEVNGRAEGDEAGVFSVGGVINSADTDCQIIDETTIEYQLTNLKELERGVTYRLVLFVYNPDEPKEAEDWSLFTYKTQVSTGVKIPLDSMRIPGYFIGGVIPLFLIENWSGEKMGSYMVRKIMVRFRFLENFKNGHYIDLSGPPGYDVRMSSDSTTCINFAWRSNNIPMPDSAPPSCTCVGDPVRCRFRLIANEPSERFVLLSRGVVVEANDELTFMIGALNPAQMPDIVENFWTIQHWDETDTLVSAATTMGWQITGQILGLYLDISQGEKRRSGAVSTMELRFTPTVWASVIELDMKEPAGFDFSRSLFENPWRRDDTSTGGRLVVTGGQLHANVPTSLLLQSVGLGNAGKTRIDLKLYSDEQLATMVAYRLNFIRGYRQSGAVVLLDQRLYSEEVIAHHEIENVRDVMIPLLPAWADDPFGVRQIARMELIFATNANLYSGGGLIIKFSVAGIEGLSNRIPCRPYWEPDRLEKYKPELSICNMSQPLMASQLAMPSLLSSQYLQYPGSVSQSPCIPMEFLTIVDEKIIGDDITGVPVGSNLTVNSSTIFSFQASGAVGADATILNGDWYHTGYKNQRPTYTNTQGGVVSIEFIIPPCPYNVNCDPVKWSALVNGVEQYYVVQDTLRPPLEGWIGGGATGAFKLHRTEADGVALRAHVVHRLRMWVRPSISRNFILIETDDGYETAQTTNDGLSEVSVAVTKMTMSVRGPYQRMPPDSVITVDITLKGLPSQESFTQLDIALPPGYSPYGMGVTSDPMGEQRVTSKIDISPQGVDRIRSGSQTFQLRINTPSIDSRDPRWFIITRNAVRIGEGALAKTYLNTTGWCETDGFAVLPMPLSMQYAPLEDFVGYLSMTFNVPKEVDGKVATIDAPQMYKLICPDKTILKMPCNDRPTLPEQVNVTLVGGSDTGLAWEYAFILSLITPKIEGPIAQQPVPHWSVRILTEDLLVADATGPFRQRLLVDDIVVSRPTLSWRTQPQYDESSTAVITITFHERVFFIKTFLIELPQYYKHDIVHMNQLKSLNRLFPTAIDIQWRDYSRSLRFIRIFVNDNVKPDSDYILGGTFQFEFPVRVPIAVPTNTEWYFSMCSDYLCTSRTDKSVMAAFPIPNVDPIKAARTWTQAVPTAGAVSSSPSALLTFALGIISITVVRFITRR